MWRRSGPPGAPAAVLLPGTASTADLVCRMFAAPLAAHGYALVTDDPPRGGDVVERQLAALDDAARRFAPRLMGGVSLGAHLVAGWALARGAAAVPPDGLLLAMPAWTGRPGGVAAASRATADEIALVGAAATLARIKAVAPGWVADELAAAWPAYADADLEATLRATAAASAPTVAALTALTVPCGLVALVDDPMHPVTVARRWTQAIPRAALVETTRAAVGADRAALGRAVLSAWHRASGSPDRTAVARRGEA